MSLYGFIADYDEDMGNLSIADRLEQDIREISDVNEQIMQLQFGTQTGYPVSPEIDPEFSDLHGILVRKSLQKFLQKNSDHV